MNPSSIPGAALGAGENNLVVARYRNGQVVKGYTRDFFPDRPSFHVLVKGATGPEGVQPIKTAELKALFFVRDLVGNRLRNKNRKFPPVDTGPQQGRRIAVLFEDGELIVGHCQTYSIERPGFIRKMPPVHLLDLLDLCAFFLKLRFQALDHFFYIFFFGLCV